MPDSSPEKSENVPYWPGAGNLAFYAGFQFVSMNVRLHWLNLVAPGNLYYDLTFWFNPALGS